MRGRRPTAHGRTKYQWLYVYGFVHPAGNAAVPHHHRPYGNDDGWESSRLPGTDGYPVLSVYQTDIIVYGSDLRDYLRREFASGPITTAPPDGPRYISFWSRFLD